MKYLIVLSLVVFSSDSFGGKEVYGRSEVVVEKIVAILHECKYKKSCSSNRVQSVISKGCQNYYYDYYKGKRLFNSLGECLNLYKGVYRNALERNKLKKQLKKL